MRARLMRAFYWLLAIIVLHTLAMVVFESLGGGDALWLTLTTMTTVGYTLYSWTETLSLYCSPNIDS